MIRESLLFVAIFVAGIKCDARTRYRENYDLSSDLDKALDFFEEIKSDYYAAAAAAPENTLNKDALTKIDRAITEYVRNASKIVSNRRRRHSTSPYKYPNEGTVVFGGFVDVGRFDRDGTRDMELFSLGPGEHEDAAWFAAVLDDREVTVHRITINDGGLNAAVASHPVTNGTRFVVNGCACGALLVIEHGNGSVLVLSFTKVPNDAGDDSYVLHASDQDLGVNSTTDLAIWNGVGMNQLHLGVATRDNVSVYTWFGKYFDPTQVIDQGAVKLIPFRSKGSMHLAIITADSAATLIFRHFLESNEFLLIQRLPPSRDAAFFEFQFEHGRFADRFLCLSTAGASIIYKQTRDRFVPFQRIPLDAEFAVPIVSVPRRAVLLLFGVREAATTTVYQYDGWRFVRTAANSSGKTFAVDRFRPVSSYHVLHGNELLLCSTNDGQWTLKRPIWVRRRNSYEDFRDEAKRWIVEAKSRAKRTIGEFANPQRPVEVSKGRIGRLRATNVNGYDSQKLLNLSKEYRKLVSRLEQRSGTSPERRTLTLDSIRARRIRVKCEGSCNANQLHGENLRRFGKMSETKTSPSNYHRLVNVGDVKEWKCPFVSFPMEDVNVRDSINGISLNDLRDRTLKVIGDQVVSGEHVFINLNATDVYAPLDIATNFTSQRLIMKNVEAKRLTSTTAGILLPLDGNFSTTITGSIETDEATMKSGSVKLNGKPTGDGTRRLRPVTFVDEPVFLYNDITVENVKIETLAATKLIDKKSGGAVETVFENAISLREDRIPVSLIFSSEKTKWSNVVVFGGPWVTKNSSRNAAAIRTISGRKHFPRDVEITESSRDRRPYYPKIRANLCGNYVIAPEIETQTLVIKNGTVKNTVTSTHAFGRLGERYSSSSVSFFNPVFGPGSEPGYRRRNVTATNVFATRSNLDTTQKTRKLGDLRFDHGSLIVNASFDAIELTGDSLLSPVRLDVETPAVGTTRVRKVISEKKSNIRVVNEVDLNDLSANAVKIDRMISLANVKFRNGFSVGCVHAFRRSSDPNDIVAVVAATVDAPRRLGRKHIFGRVETNAINAPLRSFQITQNGLPIDVIVQGSARFSREPRIKVTNGVRLDDDRFGQVWLTTDDAVISGTRLHFRDAVDLGVNVTALNVFPSPASNDGSMYLDPETWKNVSRRIFSRTKSQEISVDAFLKDVRAGTVVAASNAGSTVKCSSTDFGDVFENSLKKNEDREVRAIWTFDEMNVTEALHVEKEVNGFDLGNDVARYDSKENVFSGKKTVLTVTAENFDGYDSQGWFANALTSTGTKQGTTIEGGKIFKSSVRFNAGVSAKGTVVDDSSLLLSKSTNQTIRGPKEIRGFLDASELVVDGSVNDVNLTELTNRQLKKSDDDRSLRRIKSSIEFQSGLDIVDGDLEITGAYADAETSYLHASYANQTSWIVRAIKEFSLTAETIVAAFGNRATYLRKLEIVKDAAANVSGLRTLENIQCGATHFSPRCIRGSTTADLDSLRTEDLVLLRSSVVNGEELIILVRRDSVSIFSLDGAGPSIHSRVPVLNLHVSKIMDAFLEETRRSLWIVLRLSSHALVLRYHGPYRKPALESYVLPGSDAFGTSRSPNGQQLLLVSSDGLWNLGGLATPRNLVRIPFEEKIEIRVSKFDYYLRFVSPGNRTTAMKARYATTAV